MGADRDRTMKVQSLKAEFEVLSMNESETVDDFMSNIRTLGDTVDKLYVVKKILRAMPSKFVQIASTIEQFAGLDKTTFEEVLAYSNHMQYIKK